jgi:hypothetical protein
MELLMILRKHSLAAVLVVLAALVWQPVANADSFSVSFDNSGNGSAAIVGTGTFSFTGSLGDGTYFLSALPGYNMSFNIGTSSFTNADINTTISAVLVVIYGGGTQFYFDNTGTFGSHGGSLDFDGPSGSYLTTEPNYYGPAPLDLYQAVDSAGNSYFGVYQTTPVATPEPSSLLLLGSGLLGIVGAVRRKLRA